MQGLNKEILFFRTLKQHIELTWPYNCYICIGLKLYMPSYCMKIALLMIIIMAMDTILYKCLWQVVFCLVKFQCKIISMPRSDVELCQYNIFKTTKI